jgi:hypothetical protein
MRRGHALRAVRHVPWACTAGRAACAVGMRVLWGDGTDGTAASAVQAIAAC